jgi:integrase
MPTLADINPHCESPHLLKEGVNWNIRFWYKYNGRRLSKKMASGLNGSDYIHKVKGIKVEIRKTERKAYAKILISTIEDKLKKLYFDPITKEFEDLDKADLPFSKYLDEYIDYTPKKKRSESTKDIYRSYNNVIKAYLNEHETPNLKLKEFNREKVERFLSSIEKKNSTGQRDNYLVYLKGVFKYCTEYLEILDRNPIKLIHTINTETSVSNRSYDENLRGLVFAEAKKMDIHFWLLLRMLFHTLRRPDELLKLRKKDFNLKQGLVSFNSGIIKTNKTEYSTLSPNLLNDINSLITDDMKADYFFLGSDERIGKNARYIKHVYGFNKTPYDHFQDKFKILKKKLNLPDGYTIYGFKHSGINYLIEVEKFSDSEIIQTTGHTNTAILGRYAREAKRERRERKDNV